MEQVVDKLLEKCFSFMDEIIELSTIVEDLRKEVSQLKEENEKLRSEVKKNTFKSFILYPEPEVGEMLLNDKK